MGVETMSDRKLEDLTCEECWQLYLTHNPPPPDIPADEVAFVRQIYFAGFGAMMMLVKRLESESPDRRADILKRIEAQLWADAHAMAGRAPT